MRSRDRSSREGTYTANTSGAERSGTSRSARRGDEAAATFNWGSAVPQTSETGRPSAWIRPKSQLAISVEAAMRISARRISHLLGFKSFKGHAVHEGDRHLFSVGHVDRGHDILQPLRDYLV